MKPFVQIVENKDISTNTKKAKMNAWLEITEQFNTANKRIRDKKQLVKQWKVAKLTSKKQLSMLRRTGGEPKTPSPSAETLEILELMPQEFEVDFDEFDCDGTNLSDEFNFGAASFEDMHKFRVMESERQQKEHELRMKNMAEMHDQAMINLKLQEEVLRTMLEQCRKK